MTLRLVDRDAMNLRRVYVAGHADDACSWNVAVAVLKEKGYDVANENWWEEQGNLRTSIALLTTCDYICLLEDWWVSTEAHYLQNIAAWLRLRHVDPKTGGEVETVSLKGVRA